MPLFRKKPTTDELVDAPPPPFEIGWCKRLGFVGDALDEAEGPFLDLAVVTDGPYTQMGALINALSVRQSVYHVGFAPLLFRVTPPETNMNEEIDPYPAEIKQWGKRLRGVGSLLDITYAAMRSATVLDVEGGAVVNALVPGKTFDPTWNLHTFEFSNQQIERAYDAAHRASMTHLLNAERPR